MSRHRSLKLLDLTLEVRLEIYSHLFGGGKVIFDAGNRSRSSCLIPNEASFNSQRGQSSQLLRACKTIFYEAQPILYANTTFQIMTHAFAGSLPRSLSDGHPTARFMRHVIWQLDCGFLKHFYPEDFDFQKNEMEMLDSLEIHCRADTWRESFCGGLHERKPFMTGRKEIREYGKLLLRGMQDDKRLPATMTEEQRFLGKGEVRFGLERQRGS